MFSNHKEVLQYESKTKSKNSRSTKLIWLCVLAGIVGIGCFCFNDYICKRRADINLNHFVMNKMVCQNNLRFLGDALNKYANHHHGQYPNQLEDVYNDFEPELKDHFFKFLICPASKDRVPAATTLEGKFTTFHQAGHISYIYLGKGLTINCPIGTPILYETLGNHDEPFDRNVRGINVLYKQQDGFVVEFLLNNDARVFLAAHSKPRNGGN